MTNKKGYSMYIKMLKTIFKTVIKLLKDEEIATITKLENGKNQERIDR